MFEDRRLQNSERKTAVGKNTAETVKFVNVVQINLSPISFHFGWNKGPKVTVKVEPDEKIVI